MNWDFTMCDNSLSELPGKTSRGKYIFIFIFMLHNIVVCVFLKPKPHFT